jgi:hypothetical protein
MGVADVFKLPNPYTIHELVNCTKRHTRKLPEKSCIHEHDCWERYEQSVGNLMVDHKAVDGDIAEYRGDEESKATLMFSAVRFYGRCHLLFSLTATPHRQRR